MTVFDYYMTVGTDITAEVAANLNQLSECVLSPYTNTFGGGVNPHGVYIIDSLPGELSIRRCRIVGTLVVRSPTQLVKIEKTLNWEPARPNWPALLLEGSLEVVLEDPDVSESDLVHNLNPPGTPWQGSTDSDLSDNYPSALAGIFYATGNVLFDGKSSNNSPKIDGTLVCGGWWRVVQGDQVGRARFNLQQCGGPRPASRIRRGRPQLDCGRLLATDTLAVMCRSPSCWKVRAKRERFHSPHREGRNELGSLTYEESAK